MKFYLGTHRPEWLGRIEVPLFVSHRTLHKRKTFPKAVSPWAIDSGGFTEISMHGKWVTQPDDYVEAVARYQREIENLEWAAPMDWMCEPIMLEKTGLTIRDHQERTVANYLEIRNRGPFVPVLQGWTINDYLACVDLYSQAGVDLASLPRVGIGSVCRRQNELEIGRIIIELQPLRLHGFGVKSGGVEQYGHLLESSDSMAWSMNARFGKRIPGCTHPGKCTNCERYALRWRKNVIWKLESPTLFDERKAETE